MTNKHRLNRLTIAFRALARDAHGFVLDGTLGQPNAAGMRRFAGIATLSDGREVSTFSANLSGAFFEVRRKVSNPRGRPKNEPAHIAKFLHEHMASAIRDEFGGTLTAWRARALTAQGFGNATDPSSQSRQLKDGADAAATSVPVCRDAGIIMSWPGDETGAGRSAVLFGDDAITERPDNDTVRVSGSAWVCHFGDRTARCAEIAVTFQAQTPEEVADQCAFINMLASD